MVGKRECTGLLQQVKSWKNHPGSLCFSYIPLSPIIFEGGEKEYVNRDDNNNNDNASWFTRVKLLRATNILWFLAEHIDLLRLKEVMKVLRAKKNAKLKSEKVNCSSGTEIEKIVREKHDQAIRSDRPRRSLRSTNYTAERPNSWRPFLNSICESGS